MKKHTFAFYKKDISVLLVGKKIGSICSFKDTEFYNRLIRVVRIHADDCFILFDEKVHATISVHEDMINKKRFIIGTIVDVKQNKKLIPEVTLAVGLLKKDAWEQVVYFAAQMGATRLIPILSEKVQRSFDAQKEFERLQKIMISACEQSKNFVFPEISEQQNLSDFLNQTNKDCVKRICFDEHADSFFNVLDDLHKKKYGEIVLLIGCEGGFSESEIQQIKSMQFSFTSLTPTILRSVEAVAVGLGVVRSVCAE